MEKEFLREVASAYVKSGELDSVFVLPNRRSLKFFQKYLGLEYSAVHGKPLFSPQLVTINEWLGGLSGMAAADVVEQLYILYKEYIAIRYRGESLQDASKKESFDEFVHWGDLLLKDFNDVDKYMVDARQLFTNIKDLKELESDFSFLSPRQLEAVKCFWTNYLKGGKLSEKKEFFGSVWGIMFQLYTNFKTALARKGMGYEGQIYREVAESVEGMEFARRVVFIGFNAPNRCERRIMSYLRDAGVADFYWDFYGPLLTDRQNGASEIIAECVREYPSMYKINDTSVLPASQKFEVVASPSGVGQSFVVADILNRLYPGEEVAPQQAFNTAVVLPDEKLLLPVLNSIPDKFNSINVTMGYPITTTPLISFMELWRRMQLDVKERGGKLCFYHKSLLEFLSHEYVKRVISNSATIIENIKRQNMIFIEADNPMLSESRHLLDIPLSTADIAVKQMEILKVLDEVLERWDREFIYHYYTKISRLAELDIPMEPKTYFKLAEQVTRGIVVPFKGEPLAGLQIMGTLETRALDFDNVIIISANEGKFPAASADNSIIPYNLRVGFGLPTYELQDGIASYHFYRSICRAKNIFMVYDTRGEAISTGEVSRYVKQLKYHFGLDVQERAVAVSPVLGGGTKGVEKSPEVMKLLMDSFTDGGPRCLSASAVQNYITCPLKFYFENVEGIREEDEVTESVESNVFGSIFHYVMENLYKKYEGKIVGKDDVKALSKDSAAIEKYILEGFRDNMKIESITGQNKIVEALLKRYVAYTLKEDEAVAPFKYIAGERRLRCSIPIFNGAYRVNFKAIIDRIDKIIEGNITRISDYKTGSVTKPSANFELNQLFDKDGDGRYKATLQLYLYGVIYFDELLNGGGEIPNTSLTVYPLKKIAKDHLMQISLEHDRLIEFKGLLTECVEEIFNKDISFYPNPQDKHCSYCKLSALCRG